MARSSRADRGGRGAEQDRLSSLGLGMIGSHEHPEVHAEAVRIARRLHAARQKVIGFIPATPRVAVPPAALQIGSALVELTGATVAFVDANMRYPALSAIASSTAEGGERGAKGAVPAPTAEAVASALRDTPALNAAEADASAPRDPLAELRRGSLFKTRWLRGSLAVLTPPKAERAGQAVPQLASLLLDGIDLFEYVLVDLTGFDVLGEHGSAAACMDAVVLVGRAHRTREKDLLRFLNEMPSSRFLGVLLLG